MAQALSLTRLGVRIPTIEDLPEPLSAFRGRRVWHSTLGEIRCNYADLNPAIFVKPVSIPKAFPARVVRAFRDLESVSKPNLNYVCVARK